MTTLEAPPHAQAAEHEHGAFIAHHFDSPRQQFDSGKLGIWLFLVTEILFFSGLFCAYTLYRAHHPEIFVQASTFLDKVLGGINTIVLLFSSLTMALAVRSAQLGQRRPVVVFLVLTMVCAAIFLGIKAVEYSHKWDEGIFVRAYFHLHEHAAGGLSRWLVVLSVPFAALLGLSLVGIGVARGAQKPALVAFFTGLAIMFGGYFLGAVGGKLYMNVQQPAAVVPTALEAATPHEPPTESPAAAENAAPHAPLEIDRDIGLFFSIYYCMTGLHAVHVLAGMAALSWLLYRSILGHWRPDYFGPVEYVGLYWHLVDLIWIFLFPLLYLIN